jgi:sugar phosphate isomerase/epimerase
MRFAICNELFEGWDFGDVCRFVKVTGYDGLELAPFTLAVPITDVSKQRRAELAAAARDAGVEIVGLHWLLAKTQGLHLTSSDSAVRARTSSYLVALAEACRDLGGRIMVFGSPAQRSLQPGVSRDRAFDLATETFRQAMPRIADCGVTICMEPLTDETDFVNTCDEAVRLIDAVDHRHRHSTRRQAMSRNLFPCPTIRRHAHCADTFTRTIPTAADRSANGFRPIFQALNDAGITAGFGGSIRFRADPVTIAKKSIEYMRSQAERSWAASCFADLPDLNVRSTTAHCRSH